jgi:phosphoenolpyruvate phosphomutase-like protein
MSQAKKAKYFASLHKKGAPIVLYNAWDSGSAVTIQGAGAKAIARSRPQGSRRGPSNRSQRCWLLTRTGLILSGRP